MKRTLSLLLALVLLLSGCGSKPTDEDSTTTQDAETIARVILAFLDENEEEDALTWYLEPDDVGGYVTDCYKLEELNWLDGAVVRMEGARAFELAVLLVDEWDIETVIEALQQYLLDRKGDFTGYFPDQEALVDNALILTKGQWAALLVCADPNQASSAFESCFGEGINAVGVPAVLGPDEGDLRPDGRIIYKDPGKDDMTLFDNSAILAAWENGDSSSLSKQDKAVLDAAKRVFEECVTPEMSDYDKELALYTWLTGNVSYDQAHYEKKGAPRTSYEPYGPLVQGKGVCLGYATAFQLLMDMADIECITVTGAAFMSRENHAWNMVKLNGEWYCVDPTWDMDLWISAQDVEPFVQYSYFNVTSDYMAGTDHQWDYDSVPEATAEDYGRP
ncbi:transglutaminase domain-containing protein [Oscillospiraceae bacterium 44-34]